MGKKYFKPDFSPDGFAVEDILMQSDMIVDDQGDFKDHLIEWGF